MIEQETASRPSGEGGETRSVEGAVHYGNDESRGRGPVAFSRNDRPYVHSEARTLHDPMLSNHTYMHGNRTDGEGEQDGAKPKAR
jgi:hypothetical protein